MPPACANDAWQFDQFRHTVARIVSGGMGDVMVTAETVASWYGLSIEDALRRLVDGIGFADLSRWQQDEGIKASDDETHFSRYGW